MRGLRVFILRGSALYVCSRSSLCWDWHYLQHPAHWFPLPHGPPTHTRYACTWKIHVDCDRSSVSAEGVSPLLQLFLCCMFTPGSFLLLHSQTIEQELFVSLCFITVLWKQGVTSSYSSAPSPLLYLTERCQQEIDTVLEGKEKATFNDRNNMPYMQVYHQSDFTFNSCVHICLSGLFLSALHKIC